MITGTTYRGYRLTASPTETRTLPAAYTQNDVPWDVRDLGLFDSWNAALAAVDAVATEPMPTCIDCTVCGLREVPCWNKELNAKLERLGLCFFCNFYMELVEKSGFIVDGHHYMIGEEKGPKEFRGHAGREFKIQMDDGQVIKTTNLWSQGRIPPYLRDKLPNNATWVD